MVSARHQQIDDDDLPPHDPWRTPVVLVSWLILLAIAWNLMGTLQNRSRLARELNQAESLAQRQPLAGAEQAMAAMARASASKDTLGERFLSLIRMPPPHYEIAASNSLSRLADYYYANRQEDAALRVASLCLVMNPHQTGLGEMIGEMCIQTRNWELGWQGAKMAEKLQSSMASILTLHFGRHYSKTPPPAP